MRDKDSATIASPIALAGLGLASLGVLTFSFSFPGTVFALDGLDPYLIGIGRAAIAALLAAAALAAVRAPWPARRHWGGLLGVGAGVVFGFPVLSSLALDHGATASHGAVVIGLLPAATAAFAVLRARERPSAAFWLAAGAGALCITAFTLAEGGGTFTAADLLFVGALVAAAYGYAEGGRLARELAGWRVISWALIFAAPITIPVTVVLLGTTHPAWTPKATLGFAYVAAFSMYLGFFVWYAGLGRAGVARASQVQLAQPILTIIWSAWLLDEALDAATVLAALGVVACVAWTQRTRVRTLRDVTSERTMGATVSHSRAG